MDALLQYSSWKLEDLVAEYSIQYPFLESLLLNLFYFYPNSQLTREEFDELFATQKKDFIEQYGDIYFEPTDVLLQTLYSIGFLGVVHNGNNLYESLGDKFILPYATLLEIHPAFRLGLNITDSIKKDTTVFDQRTQNVSGNQINIGGNVSGSVIIGGSENLVKNWSTAVGSQLSKYKVGERLKGTIKKIISAGLIVELEPGISGLVHISQISNSFMSSDEVAEQFEIEESVRVTIISINLETQRISLSMKQ
jgi:hypothetical protein